MTPDEQLGKWLAGDSVHNKERDECCPDFSCCRPKLKWPKEKRRLFFENPQLRERMLTGALVDMLEDYYGPRVVHVAGAFLDEVQKRKKGAK